MVQIKSLRSNSGVTNEARQHNNIIYVLFPITYNLVQVWSMLKPIHTINTMLKHINVYLLVMYCGQFYDRMVITLIVVVVVVVPKIVCCQQRHPLNVYDKREPHQPML